MCGLVGIINDNESIKFNIRSLIDKLEHRGPDDVGWFSWSQKKITRGRESLDISGRVLLGHRRLSILDLSECGWQPMSTLDERYHISYNGEIYNFIELRCELEKLGYVFKSKSDTEVIIHAWAEWGEGSIPRMKGMFAFAIFDVLEKKVFLVRDPFGIKPLFYCKWENGLAFSSEMQVLWELPGVSRTLHPESVYSYLHRGITDNGERTLVSDIYQLPAAHSIQIDILSGDVGLAKPYWKLEIDRRLDISFDKAKKRLRDLFLQNVEMHLRSDVAVGAALSGGIDSSAIVCAIKHIKPEVDLHTFSFIADQKNISEEKWVDLVVKHTGAISHKVGTSYDQLIKDLPHLMKVQGTPFGSTSIYAQYQVFKCAKENGITVMLDGQGADELFAGYIGYQSNRLTSLIANGDFFKASRFLKSSCHTWGQSPSSLLLSSVKPLLPNLLLKIYEKTGKGSDFPSWLNEQSFSDDIKGTLNSKHTREHGKNYLKYSLLRSLQGNSIPHLLRYEDRNSMAFSVESRVPFLTTDLAEFAMRLPEKYLVSDNGTSKYIFREAMRGIVPDVILDRKDKIGFATPQNIWLTNLSHWVEDSLSKSKNCEYLEYSEVSKEWQDIISGKKGFDNKVWRWVNFLVWKSYVEECVEPNLHN